MRIRHPEDLIGKILLVETKNQFFLKKEKFIIFKFSKEYEEMILKPNHENWAMVDCYNLSTKETATFSFFKNDFLELKEYNIFSMRIPGNSTLTLKIL